MGATENHAVQHPGQLDIGSVSGGARDFVPAVVTDRPGAQHPIGPWALMVSLCRGRHTTALLLEVGNVESVAPTAAKSAPHPLAPRPTYRFTVSHRPYPLRSAPRRRAHRPPMAR